jgi:mannonate dehydratase
MIHIAEYFGPQPTLLWTLARQVGIRHAVSTLPSDEIGGEQPWDYMPLLRMKQRFVEAGFELSVIESRPPLNKAKLGLDGRDDEIATVCTLIENMGRLGIPVWCYEWMTMFNWMRTSTTTPTRGGAYVSSYDNGLMQDAPLTDAGIVTEEQLWENLEYFLKKVVPVAEKWNVKLAMHPDDPPLSPIRGVGRIMRSVENFQRLVDLTPSPVNGITLCQGNFALMTDDLPGVIRHFGAQQKIFFVHMRDVRGDVQQFAETFHDDGPTDMLACLQAYRDIGFDGVLRPDHVPTMAGESNANPGYEIMGRLFAVGYLRGLHEAVYGKQSATR